MSHEIRIRGQFSSDAHAQVMADRLAMALDRLMNYPSEKPWAAGVVRRRMRDPLDEPGYQGMDPEGDYQRETEAWLEKQPHPTKAPCDHRPCKSWCHAGPTDAESDGHG